MYWKMDNKFERPNQSQNQTSGLRSEDTVRTVSLGDLEILDHNTPRSAKTNDVTSAKHGPDDRDLLG